MTDRTPEESTPVGSTYNFDKIDAMAAYFQNIAKHIAHAMPNSVLLLWQDSLMSSVGISMLNGMCKPRLPDLAYVCDSLHQAGLGLSFRHIEWDWWHQKKSIKLFQKATCSVVVFSGETITSPCFTVKFREGGSEGAKHPLPEFASSMLSPFDGQS